MEFRMASKFLLGLPDHEIKKGVQEDKTPHIHNYHQMCVLELEP